MALHSDTVNLELELGAACPRCAASRRRVLTSVMVHNVKRRNVECCSCGKRFYVVEMTENAFNELVDAARRDITGGA